MTRPRKHAPATAYIAEVTLGPGRRVPIDVYNALVDAYAADHPDFQVPRAGHRGNASRLGLPGLPSDWWRPYENMIQESPRP